MGVEMSSAVRACGSQSSQCGGRLVPVVRGVVMSPTAACRGRGRGSGGGGGCAGETGRAQVTKAARGAVGLPADCRCARAHTTLIQALQISTGRLSSARRRISLSQSFVVVPAKCRWAVRRLVLLARAPPGCHERDTRRRILPPVPETEGRRQLDSPIR